MQLKFINEKEVDELIFWYNCKYWKPWSLILKMIGEIASECFYAFVLWRRFEDYWPGKKEFQIGEKVSSIMQPLITLH